MSPIFQSYCLHDLGLKIKSVCSKCVYYFSFRQFGINKETVGHFFVTPVHIINIYTLCSFPYSLYFILYKFIEMTKILTNLGRLYFLEKIYLTLTIFCFLSWRNIILWCKLDQKVVVIYIYYKPLWNQMIRSEPWHWGIMILNSTFWLLTISTRLYTRAILYHTDNPLLSSTF